MSDDVAMSSTPGRRRRFTAARILLGFAFIAGLILFLFWYWTPTIGRPPLQVIAWDEMTSSIEVSGTGDEFVASLARMRRGKPAADRKAACIVKLPEGTKSRWIEDDGARDFTFTYCGAFQVIHSGKAGRVIDRASGKTVIEYQGIPFWTMAASADGHWFAGRNDADGIRIWDLRRAESARRIQCESVHTFALANDGSELYVVTDASHCDAFRLPTLERVPSLTLAPPVDNIPIPLQDVAFSEDRTLVAILNMEGSVHVWNLRKRLPIASFVAHTQPTPDRAALSFAARDRVLLTTGGNLRRGDFKFESRSPYYRWPKVRVAEIVAWDVRSWRWIERWDLDRPSRQIRSIPNSSLFLTLDSDPAANTSIAIRKVTTR